MHIRAYITLAPPHTDSPHQGIPTNQDPAGGGAILLSTRVKKESGGVFRKQMDKSGEMAPWLKAFAALLRGPGFGFRHPY